MPELIKSSESFENIVKDTKLTVVHFSADWAEQCAQINDLLDELKKQPDFSEVQFYQCLAEDLSEISLKYNVDSVPTTLLFQSSKVLNRIDGTDTAKITATIKKYIQSDLNVSVVNKVPLEERLKQLINKSKVMLFMKGDRTAPRCGFSKQIVQILNDTGVLYETFDILTDEEVRQGLKTFSDWPTYPQLYVNGELIGGLDIVKEMLNAGELKSALSA
ncbi:glutaredoxin-3 [Agrilus planipennis]|uniref:Glutaredoxin-3 n=1 Tax=Agrilus planipennis TaxID=224129 RepID=A0A1W4WZZ6_AGRPL|nr:glutaredoxin-3 [Agrilus planipennis]